MKNRHPISPVLAFLPLVFLTFMTAAADSPMARSLRSLNNAAGGYPIMTNKQDGYVTHLRSLPYPVPESSSLPAEARARAFLSTYRDLFLDVNTPLDVHAVRSSPIDAAGASHVRFQQSFKGVPVRGGEAMVHLNNAGVTSVQSKLLTDLSNIDITPRISAGEAIAAARSAVDRRHKNAPASFGVPQLEIINAERLRGKQFGESRLAWLIEVTGGPDISIWVDAHTGQVILQVNRIAHVMARDVEDFRGNCTAVIDSSNSDSYIDGGNVPTAGDALFAWNNAKNIYDYFLTLGRDGLDGTDGSNGSYSGRGTFIVNVCSSDFVRPGPPLQEETTAWDRIALWDRNIPDIMKFSAGMAAADDVMAHEYTHALAAYLMPDVDNKPYGFLLAGQSGAIAEGFADIFGQIVDLTMNGDTGSTRWDIGEAATGGPFRNLMDPNLHEQPGKVTDLKYYCGADDDVAIHVNSGVLSHAFALAVDGGSYNGITVSGIGLDKAARLFYKALAKYMLPTSTFVLAYNALLDAADELVGAGTLTAADRISIQNALNAVELQVNPCSSGKASYCPAGQVKTNLFTDGFENPASGKWTSSVITGINHWNAGSDVSGIYRPNTADVSITSSESKPLTGNYALWADNKRSQGISFFGDSMVTMTNAITVPDHGNIHMQFEHKFDFEATNDLDNGDPDGGVIEYSVDGGTVWNDAKEFIRDGRGYQNFIQTGQENPLAGRWAFVGNTWSSVTSNLEYVSTQLDLEALAGQSVKFRFHMGTDTFAVGHAGLGGLGWMIDDVAIYTCSQVVATPSTGLELSENGGNATFTVQLVSAPSVGKHVILSLSSTDETEGIVEPAELVFDGSNWNIPQTVTVKSVDDIDVDGSQKFSIKIVRGNNTDDAAYDNMPDTYVSLVATDNDVAKRKGGGIFDLFTILVMLAFMGKRSLRRVFLIQQNINNYFKPGSVF